MNKKTLKTLSISAAIAALSLMAQPAMAGESGHQHAGGGHSAEHMNHQDGHMGGDMDGHKMNGHAGMDMKQDHKMFLKKKAVDGFTVSFHVMKAKAGMEHGGSHNLMVKVEKNDAALTDIAVNSKVFYADKSSESKMLMKMGDWFMAGYDLNKAGKHGIMVLFKTADGKKHKTSVYYAAGE